MGSVPARPKEIDPIVLLAGHQRFGVHRARIPERPCWEEILLLKGFMQVCKSSTIRQRCWCRLNGSESSGEEDPPHRFR